MKETLDRLYNCKWGVFNHYLFGMQNNAEHFASLGRQTDWDTCVKELDVDKLAANLHSMGAKYYFITVMQGRKYMIAPNDTFDRIAGTKPGEACSTRDLIEDLYQALSKYGIDLYLYYTGDGPYKEDIIGMKFGFIGPRKLPLTEEFVIKWASVLEEYSVRYGDKVKGWWIDGCYRNHFGYNDHLLAHYYRAAKKGNPHAITAFNDGLKNELFVNYKDEEFTCGEFEEFTFIPKGRFVGNAQAHILAPIGEANERRPGKGVWGNRGLLNTPVELADYAKRVHTAGGVVTFDMALFRDGSFDKEQQEALTYVGRELLK